MCFNELLRFDVEYRLTTLTKAFFSANVRPWSLRPRKRGIMRVMGIIFCLFGALSGCGSPGVLRGRESLCHRLAFAKKPPRYKLRLPQFSPAWKISRDVQTMSAMPPIDAVIEDPETGARFTMLAKQSPGAVPMTAAACTQMHLTWQGMEVASGVRRDATYGTAAKIIESFDYEDRARGVSGAVAYISFHDVKNVLVLIEGNWSKKVDGRMRHEFNRLIHRLVIVLAEGGKS